MAEASSSEEEDSRDFSRKVEEAGGDNQSVMQTD